MGKIKIKSVAVLNEDNPEFLSKLMKKGVDAVEPEMEKQIANIEKKKIMEIPATVEAVCKLVMKLEIEIKKRLQEIERRIATLEGS